MPGADGLMQVISLHLEHILLLGLCGTEAPTHFLAMVNLYESPVEMDCIYSAICQDPKKQFKGGAKSCISIWVVGFHCQKHPGEPGFITHCG